MRTKPTNLSLSDPIKAKARDLMRAESHKSMTALVEQLIRDAYEAHQKVSILHDEAPKDRAGNVPPPVGDRESTKPVTYKVHRK